MRRSLELVQALLHVADGGSGLPEVASWPQLQQMISRADFIARVLRLRPAALAARSACAAALPFLPFQTFVALPFPALPFLP